MASQKTLSAAYSAEREFHDATRLLADHLSEFLRSHPVSYDWPRPLRQDLQRLRELSDERDRKHAAWFAAIEAHMASLLRLTQPQPPDAA